MPTFLMVLRSSVEIMLVFRLLSFAACRDTTISFWKGSPVFAWESTAFIMNVPPNRECLKNKSVLSKGGGRGGKSVDFEQKTNI